MTSRLKIMIWLPPRGDFDAWRDFTGETGFDAYAELVARAEDVQRAARAAGHRCFVELLSVYGMRRRLSKLGLSNTSEHRAEALIRQRSRRSYVLGLKVTHKACGWAVLGRGWGQRHVAGGVAPTLTDVLRAIELNELESRHAAHD